MLRPTVAQLASFVTGVDTNTIPLNLHASIVIPESLQVHCKQIYVILVDRARFHPRTHLPAARHATRANISQATLHHSALAAITDSIILYLALLIVRLVPLESLQLSRAHLTASFAHMASSRIKLASRNASIATWATLLVVR